MSCTFSLSPAAPHWFPRRRATAEPRAQRRSGRRRPHKDPGLSPLALEDALEDLQCAPPPSRIWVAHRAPCRAKAPGFVTSSVGSSSCSVAPLGMRGSTTLENLHAAPADTESLSQVLRASAISGQAMYSSMVTGSHMQRPPRRYVAHEGEGYTQQRTPQQV